MVLPQLGSYGLFKAMGDLLLSEWRRRRSGKGGEICGKVGVGRGGVWDADWEGRKLWLKCKINEKSYLNK